MIDTHTVLVTGATGFVGTHLVRRLGALGARVHALVRRTDAAGPLLDAVPGLRAWTADLRDRDAVDDCVNALRPEFVFHLAALTAARPSQTGARDDPKAEHDAYEVNLMGTRNLAMALRRIGSCSRVVRTGGIAEYGAGPAPFREDQREAPVSAYAASQVAATHLLESLHRRFRAPIVTVRPALVYGPGQTTTFLVPALIRSCLAGRPFDLTTGLQTLDFVYVADVVDALILSATTDGLDGQIINIGSGREHRTRDVAERIARLCGSHSELRHGALPDDRIGPARMVLDTTRATRLLGWTATTLLETGLQQTIDWYRTADRDRASSRDARSP